MFTQHLAESRARRQKQQDRRLQHKPRDESGFLMTRGRGWNGPHFSQSPLRKSASYSRGGIQRVVGCIVNDGASVDHPPVYTAVHARTRAQPARSST